MVSIARETRDWVLNRKRISRAIKLLRKISENSFLSPVLPTLEEVRGKNSKDSGWSKYDLFCRCASGLEVNQRFFITSNDYLGFGASSLSEDDEMWLLVSGKVPFIFRRASKGRYQLVGEAYLHGAMFGELMTDEAICRIGPIHII